MSVRRRAHRQRRGPGPSPELVAWWARGKANLTARRAASEAGDMTEFIRLRQEATDDMRPDA